MNHNLPMFCDCCGEKVKAVYPCKFVYHDGLTVDLNICVECMEERTLSINLYRKRMVAKIKARLDEMRVRKPET